MRQRGSFAYVSVVTFCLAGSVAMLCQNRPSENTYGGEPLYKIGNGVTAPRCTYAPNPEYDDKDRKRKISGSVELSLVVTKEGKPGDIKVTKSLTPGLDRQAIKAVSQWKFTPATKDGQPVATRISADVSFRLF